MINVILCGGTGTRLWPISRKFYPKQFNKILNGESLFQKTVARNRSFCENTIIVTNENLYFIAADQIEEVRGSQSCADGTTILLEPVGRNTAPAIALACFSVPEEEIVVVSPSDHMIGDEKKYAELVLASRRAAEHGFLVTFGITPHYPETGYGYIEAEKEEIIPENPALKVRAFHEKPDARKAAEYVSSGRFYWNSGMFVFRAGDFLEELGKYSPEVYRASRAAYESAKRDGQMRRIDPDLMERIPSESVDYAVMEKSGRVAVIPAEIGWTDLGSFDSLYEVLPRDGHNNTKSANAILLNSSNNMIISDERTVAILDVDDLIVVDTDDALLIGKRGSSQNIKALLEEIRNGEGRHRELADFHTTVFRPWGMFTVLQKFETSCIKKITVHPGKRLSLQRHYHRSEHWVVVRGEAAVTLGTVEHRVRENESIIIPCGEFHRVENREFRDLEIIEVQVGTILDENDIERAEDDFGRAG